MFVTLAVLKLEKSIEVKDAHFSNIDSMFVTLAVLKLEISSESKFLQPLNMRAVLVA